MARKIVPVLQKSLSHATVLPTDVSCQYGKRARTHTNPLQAIVWKNRVAHLVLSRENLYAVYMYIYLSSTTRFLYFFILHYVFSYNIL